MNHPDSLASRIRRAIKGIAPAGWLTVYTLAALMFGALAYFAGR